MNHANAKRWLAALVLIGCATALRAHHTGSMYETTAVWVRGTVVRFEPINPHTITTLEERTADGQIRLWAIEGPPRSALDRLGLAMDVFEVGATVGFCVFPYKPVEELSRMFPEADFSARRSLRNEDGSSSQYSQFGAGHVIVAPDGAMRLWEPHGLISACILSSDAERQSWLNFIGSESRARQSWCEQRRYARVESAPALRRIVEEIDSLIDEPCQ